MSIENEYPKVVSAAATLSGSATVLDWVSTGVGLAASAAGLILALMLIRKARLEQQKLVIEIEALRRASGN